MIQKINQQNIALINQVLTVGKCELIKNKLIYLLAGFFCVFSFCAHSAILQKTGERVDVEILKNYANNETLEILAKLRIHDGWKIYSSDDQDFGTPTRLEILPAANSYEITYSTPKKFVYDDEIELFGYDDIAYIKTAFSPQKNVDYKLKISWMACSDECEEETAEFILKKDDFSTDENWAQEMKIAEKSFSPNTPQKQIATFFYVIIFAFIAGVILNFMPCIFPILSIKAIYMAQNKKRYRRHNYLGALAYFSGVLLSFILIATALYILRRNGELVGWGFQLQSPWFVGFMLALFIIIFLMFLDIINIPQGQFGKFASSNSFLTGFFAVLIASPCSGPFMGMAIGYALLQPPYLYYPIFMALAAGYALPFCLIDMYPRIIARILPRSGKWMLTLKRILSVPVLLTIIWLSWILIAQINMSKIKASDWQNYSEEKLISAIENHQPVFINFTARWCLTCLLNQKSTFATEKFAEHVKDKGILLLVADWTNKDKEIFAALEKYQRSSVPLYVYYDATGESVILPQILTPEIAVRYMR